MKKDKKVKKLKVRKSTQDFLKERKNENGVFKKNGKIESVKKKQNVVFFEKLKVRKSTQDFLKERKNENGVFISEKNGYAKKMQKAEV